MVSKKPLRKKIRTIFFILVLLFVAIQFIRPPLENRPVIAGLAAPTEVKTILQRACYDCHSNETKLAWFDQPAPAYWLVVKDVKQARKVLNFSLWDSLPKAQQAAKLFEAIFQIEQKAMPLAPYRLLHHNALISMEDLAVLKNYTGTLAYKPVPDSARQQALTDQFARWTKTVINPADVKDEYNGIAYASLAGFPSWKAVSTTERYDNGTLRLILGNDITVKAIREGHTNPWPDGAVFAKVAWDQSADTAGEIQTGAFKQVEFMIRDKEKYASTFGWGWARWVGGLALKPYGKDASFVTECMNCHRPLEATNYTFTFPLTDTVHPLTGRVITSFVNKKEGTMSTLYGNEIAGARGLQEYKTGAILSLVTWSQREDPHWFGGRIPASLLSVETLTVGSESKLPQQRIKYITGLKASIMP